METKHLHKLFPNSTAHQKTVQLIEGWKRSWRAEGQAQSLSHTPTLSFKCPFEISRPWLSSCSLDATIGPIYSAVLYINTHYLAWGCRKSEHGPQPSWRQVDMRSGMVEPASLRMLALSLAPLHSTGSCAEARKTHRCCFWTNSLLLRTPELMTRNLGSSGPSCFLPYNTGRTLKTGFSQIPKLRIWESWVMSTWNLVGIRKDISDALSNHWSGPKAGKPRHKAGSLDCDLPCGTPTWEEQIRGRHSLLLLCPSWFLTDSCSQRHLLFFFSTLQCCCVFLR